MYLHFKPDHSIRKITILFAICGIILMFNPSMFAQPHPLKVNVVVVPPFSTRISDYINTPNKIIVTIFNTSVGPAGKTYNFYLLGSMSSDANVSIETDPKYIPPRAIQILPGQVYRLTQRDVQDLYDASHIIYSGTSEQQILQQGGFPEGYYTICVNAFDYNSHFRLSDDAPSGCFTFPVFNLEAPIIQKPVCGDTVGNHQQIINFTWNPPAGAPGTTMYRLRIVELLSGTQIPPDAFKTTPPNPFFETTTPAPVFIYTSALPPMTESRTYAFAIQAFDTKGNAVFKNGGWSEICYFVYGKNNKVFDNGSVVRGGHTVAPPLDFSSSLSGTIDYRFQGTSEQHPMKNINLSLHVVYVVKNATTISPGGQMQHVDEVVFDPLTQGLSDHKSIANDNMQLRATTITDNAGNFTFNTTLDPKETFGLIQKNFSASCSITFPPDPVILPGLGWVDPRVDPEWGWFENNILPETNGLNYEGLLNNNGVPAINNGELGLLTGSELDDSKTFAGNELKVWLQNALGSGFNNFNGNTGGAGGQHVMSLSGHTQNLGAVSGDLYRYLRVIVDNDYYNSPDDDFSLQPGKTLTIPAPLAGLVNTYNLTVHVKSSKEDDQAAGTNASMTGVRVEVGRISPIPEDVPFEEGQNLGRKMNMDLVASCPLISTGETEMTPKGTVVFSNLVFNKGTTIDPYQMTSSTGKRSGVFNYIPDYQTVTEGSRHGFNSQFTPEECTIEVALNPDFPRIAGRVMYKNYPVQGACCSTNLTQEKAYTDKDGYFEINNLNVIDVNANLMITKYGYEDKIISNLGKFQKGGQYWNPDIELIPWGYITGVIQDENGHPLKAEVQIDSLPFNETVTEYSLQGPGKEQFYFRAPSGSRKLHIVPDSPDFMDATFTVTVNKTPDDQPPQDLGIFKMTKNLHRIRILAWHWEYSGSMSPGKKVGVHDCWVQLNGFSKKVDDQGYADFEVSSPSTVFQVKISPPDYQPWYIPVEGSITNQPSKLYQTYSFEMKEGKSINGLVRSVPGMNGVKGARVFIAESSSNPYLYTLTGDGGFFSLHGIPQNLQKVTICAVKYDSLVTYVGDSKEADVSGQSPDVTLSLKIINDIDLTQLMGFPVEVSDYQILQDHTTLLSGHIVPQANDHFILADYGFRLDFFQLKIKRSSKLDPKGIPYAEPVDGFVKTDNYKMELRYHYGFHIDQYPAGTGILKKTDRLQITKGNDGNGIIRGRARILKNSFQFPSTLFDYEESNSFFLNEPGSQNPNIVTLAGKGSVIPTSKFGISSSTGSDLALKFIGFPSIAKISGSYLKNDSLVLDVAVTTHLKGSIETSMDIGKVQMTTAVIKPIKVSHPKDIVFGGKWSIHANELNWADGESGFIGVNASLITGFATIPVKNMKLKPEDLLLDGFSISSLKIGNTSPINLSNDAQCLFYFDPNVGEFPEPHYVIKIIGQDVTKPIASLAGLPGMQPSAKLTIGSIQVLDDDEQLYAGLENSDELLFYDVFHLKVNQITGHKNSFTLTGIYNLDLPRIPNYNKANLNFSKDPNTSQVALNMDPLTLEFSGPANVLFKANKVEHADTIFPGNFQCKGKLTFSDQGVSKTLDALLVRETSQGYVKIFPETQSFTLGSGADAVRMDNLNGQMSANKTDWDFFWFKGMMANAKNAVQPGETNKFMVQGAINSDGNSITADNLSTPLGDVKISYDLSNNTMHGSLVLDNFPLCGFEASGAADMEFGSHGWYLAGSLNFISPDPIIQQITAGLVFGNIHPVPASVKNTVLLNAKNKVWPDNLSSQLKGFFLTGYKSILPPVSFDAGFNLGGYFVGYKVAASAGLDTRFWMNFLPGSSEMGFGIMMYGDASCYLGEYMGAICPYINGEVHLGFGIPDGTYNFSTHNLTLHGNAFVGMDLTGGLCFGPLCNGCLSTGFSKTMNCDVFLQTQPKTIDFSINFTN
jgi:TANFOR domain-containing protein